MYIFEVVYHPYLLCQPGENVILVKEGAELGGIGGSRRQREMCIRDSLCIVSPLSPG